jgi:protein gp37
MKTWCGRFSSGIWFPTENVVIKIIRYVLEISTKNLAIDKSLSINRTILGGESGPGARPMERVWVMDIRDQCLRAGVPFFFKQWGGTNKKKAGRVLEGRTWDEMPRGMGVTSA